MSSVGLKSFSRGGPCPDHVPTPPQQDMEDTQQPRQNKPIQRNNHLSREGKNPNQENKDYGRASTLATSSRTPQLHDVDPIPTALATTKTPRVSQHTNTKAKAIQDKDTEEEDKDEDSY